MPCLIYNTVETLCCFVTEFIVAHLGANTSKGFGCKWSRHSLSFQRSIIHDDVIKWKHVPRYWPFVRGIHRSPVNSPHKGQWRGALMFSLICARINAWVNNGEAGDLRRNRAHYDVTVMQRSIIFGNPFAAWQYWYDIWCYKIIFFIQRTYRRWQFLCLVSVSVFKMSNHWRLQND